MFYYNHFQFCSYSNKFIWWNCAQFLKALPQVFLQDIKKSFEGAHWDAKNLLKFTCLTMKFHICHYTTLYSWLYFRKGYFSCIFPPQASPTASNIILPLSLPANCSFCSSMHLRGCSWGSQCTQGDLNKTSITLQKTTLA